MSSDPGPDPSRPDLARSREPLPEAPRRVSPAPHRGGFVDRTGDGENPSPKRSPHQPPVSRESVKGERPPPAKSEPPQGAQHTQSIADALQAREQSPHTKAGALRDGVAGGKGAAIGGVTGAAKGAVSGVVKGIPTTIAGAVKGGLEGAVTGPEGAAAGAIEGAGRAAGKSVVDHTVQGAKSGAAKGGAEGVARSANERTAQAQRHVREMGGQYTPPKPSIDSGTRTRVPLPRPYQPPEPEGVGVPRKPLKGFLSHALPSEHRGSTGGGERGERRVGGAQGGRDTVTVKGIFRASTPKQALPVAAKRGGRYTMGAFLAVMGLMTMTVLEVTGVGGGAAGATLSNTSCNYPVTGGSNPGSLANQSAAQKENARTIIGVGKGLGIPEQGWVVALATGLTESSLLVLANSTIPQSLTLPHQGVGSDHDSVGIFQQRPSAGWGSVPDLMNAAKSAYYFYTGNDPGQTTGLLKVSNWQSLPVTVAAQDVQGSANPTAYAVQEGVARALIAEVAASSPAITVGPTPTTSGITSIGGIASGGCNPCPVTLAAPTSTTSTTPSTPASTPATGGSTTSPTAGGTPATGAGGCSVNASGLPVTLPSGTIGNVLAVALGYYTRGVGYSENSNLAGAIANNMHPVDCSLLVEVAYYQGAHVDISRTTWTQYANPQLQVVQPGQEQPGDIVFFNTPEDGGGPPQHEGMVLNPATKTMINAENPSAGIRITSYAPGQFGDSTVIGFRRVIQGG